jgi:hypothetical protein
VLVTRRMVLTLALGAAVLLVAASLAQATHPRPKGANPIRVGLVPTYNACTAPNRTHGPPLAFPSCNPPSQASSYLTIGTPDANGAPAKSDSFVRLVAIVGAPGPPNDDQTVLVTLQLNDVRCKAAATACGNANAAGGPDYAGEVQVNAPFRLTDHFNATTPGGGTNPATVIDLPAPITAACSSTADTSVGASCTLSGSFTDSMLLPIGDYDGKRMLLEFGQITVSDGGPDGIVASEPQENTQFMTQGVFIP